MVNYENGQYNNSKIVSVSMFFFYHFYFHSRRLTFSHGSAGRDRKLLMISQEFSLLVSLLNLSTCVLDW